MILYKYLTPDRQGVIANRPIRFTPPRSFNDPFEFQPVLKQLWTDAEYFAHAETYIAQSLKEEFLKRGVPVGSDVAEIFKNIADSGSKYLLPILRSVEPAILEQLKQKFADLFEKHFGIFCLSEPWDSILMWGHYSQSHEGYQIGFDSEHPFFNQRRSANDEFGYLRRVRYTETRPVVSLMNSDGLDWFETKAEVWSYEQESRFFLPLKSATKLLSLNGGDIHLFEIPPECVREISFGFKCSASTEANIRASLAGWKHQPKLFRCDMDPNEYKIIRRAA